MSGLTSRSNSNWKMASRSSSASSGERLSCSLTSPILLHSPHTLFATQLTTCFFGISRPSSLKIALTASVSMTSRTCFDN